MFASRFAGDAVATQPPVNDLGFVDEEAARIGRLQTWPIADGAVDVLRNAASAADDVVMVVVHSILVPSGGPSGLDTPQDAALGKQAKRVVDRLA